MSEKDQKIRLLEAELAKLAEENKKLSTEKALLEQKKAELENTVSSLKSMMEWFHKKLFGKMSEKNLPPDPSALEPTLLDEQLSEEEQAALDAEVKAMEEKNARTIEVKAHKREVRKPVYSNLPVIVTDIYPEGMKDNPDYVEIGVENTDRLAIRPAQVYIHRIVRHKFVLKSSLQTANPERKAFEIAPLPAAPVHKCMAGASVLTDIVMQKFLYHLPFYQVVQKFKESGVIISDSTLNDWFVATCGKQKPLYDLLRKRVLQSIYIQVDESLVGCLQANSGIASA